MADSRDSGARRALPGEGTGMSGVVELAEQLAVAVKRAEKAEAMVALWERRFDAWQNWRVFEQSHPDPEGPTA